MATLRELIVAFRLKADTKAIKRFNEAIQSAKSATMDLVAWGGKLAAAYTAIGGALGFVASQAADFGEEILRSSSAFGVSAATWQENLFAFQALGASADDLADAFSTVAEKSLKARRGSKEATQAFTDLGVSISSLKGRDIGELFDIVVDGAARSTDAVRTTAALTGLFGDDLGRRIARGLHASGSSFRDYIDIVRQVGGVFNEDLLKRAQDAQIQFRLLGATFSTIRKRIGLELAPVFGQFAANMVRMIQRNTDQIEEFIFKLRDGVAKELGRLKLLVERVDKTVQTRFGGWINVVEALAVAVAGVATAMTGSKIATWISSLMPLLTAISGPALLVVGLLGLIALNIGALILIFDDLWVAIEGGDSLIGKLITKFEKLGPVGTLIAFVLRLTINNFRALAKEIDSLLAELGLDLPEALKLVAGILVNILGGALILATNLIIFLVRGGVNAFRALIAIVKAVAGFFIWFTDTLAEGLGIITRAFGNFFEFVSAWVNQNILDPVLDAVRSLLDLLSKIPGFSVSGVGEAMLSSNLRKPDAFGPPGGGNRGTRGAVSTSSSTSMQRNEFNVAVQGANSAAEGADAARGFKEEMQDPAWWATLRSYFEPGEI